MIGSGFVYEGTILPLRGPGNLLLAVYGYCLGVVNLIVFIWLFVRSPQHRWPVLIMVTGLLAGRIQYLLEGFRVLPPGILNNFPQFAIEYLIYAVALFGFHIFDPTPLAHQTVIAQMPEGMLVLDPNGRIASLNPAAEKILGASSRHVRGQPVEVLLPTLSGVDLVETKAAEMDLRLSTEKVMRDYTLEISLLKDWRGQAVGYLLLLHDVTEQKRVQAQIVQQQRALATLQERERLGRELHDGIGQVLGFVKLQAEAARTRLAQDQIAEADRDLKMLSAVAQEAQIDVREYILGAKSAATDQDGFLSTLRVYLRRFSEHYGLRTVLIEPPNWNDGLLEPTVKAQLLRIVQESLSNTRKHAQAQNIQVQIQLEGCQAQVIVQDDGVGFDLQAMAEAESVMHGLGFMRERAEEVGGSVEIQSAPGQGTRVLVEVPVKE
jgi:PAS domain S-box-containing protein